MSAATTDVLSGEDRSSTSVPVVGIGASAGGLEALREMLAGAGSATNMAFVIVQHLDPTHESMMAQLLDRHTTLDVLQCEGGESLEADRVYIIPPGRGLAIQDGRLQLTDFAQPRGMRRPIDDFFISLANDQQANAACVILSGTGADGSTGLRAVKENGGVCVVQEPSTARYDGMPVSAVGTGLVDFVKEPGEIVDCLRSFFSRRHGGADEEQAELVADHVDDLCRVLRDAIGHDFSGYKRTTLVRRVERRMHVLNIASGSAYLKRVTSDAAECEALFRDLLINVTRFFRDPDMFETLRTKVVTPLVAARAPEEEIRVWIPGCSSGEEAYSIAMLFADAAKRANSPAAFQIIATDIDEQMLAIAREGSYPASALADIPQPFRDEWVVPQRDRFTISSKIRDNIRFSNHSVVKDPPFSQVDLISCRNLLIYFDDRLQQAVMPILHYALKPHGFLFVGPSESIGRFEDLFPSVDHHARIFTRSAGGPSYPLELPGHGRLPTRRKTELAESRRSRGVSTESLAVQRIADRYGPPSMVLGQDGTVISAYGKLSRYFDFPVTRSGGNSATSLARPGLRDILGPLLRRSRDTGKRVVARDVAVQSEYGTQQVEVICEPLDDANALLVFRDSAAFEPLDEPGLIEIEGGDDHMETLEEELRLVRHKLRSTVEELETANEELKSSNEEMMSMNEELQSTNEELTTVNDELKNKVDQLTVANSDLRNFFESTDLAVVVLDGALRIRSFTEAATTIFPLKPGDRGRGLSDVTSRLSDRNYLEDARAVADGADPIRRRVYITEGARTLSLQVLPYRTQHGKTDGVTMVLTDVTDALSMERELAAERERLDLAVRAGGIGVWDYCAETGQLILDTTNRAMFGLPAKGNVQLQDVMRRITEADRDRVEIALKRSVDGPEPLELTFQIERDGERRHIKSFGRTVDGSAPKRLIGAAIDVTAEYALADTRALLLREMNHRVKNLFAIVSGMISAAARSHSDVGSMSDDLRERIAALGVAHSLASPAGEGEGIELKTLLQETLSPYDGRARLQLDGPRLAINRSCVSPLALIFHEWTTNAAKYGALSDEHGAIDVRWERDGPDVRLSWTETGASCASTSTGSGFGTLLVSTSARQLRAQVDRKSDDGRYCLEILLPGSVFQE